jgi:hypothetical protein
MADMARWQKSRAGLSAQVMYQWTIMDQLGLRIRLVNQCA